MPSLRKPSADVIRAFLDAQANFDFTYAGVGATASTPPAGYTVDHTRAKLGAGEATFVAARDALRRWEQFRLGWLEITPPAALQVGACAALLVPKMGLWWLNACRVVYMVDEESRFGFAYGTLPGHVEAGEERFLLEYDRATNEVWYDILAFSRPRHICVRLAYPLTRRMQKRFARDSVAAMQRAVDRP